MPGKTGRHAAFFKLPNSFILDTGLTYSAKRVGAALYLHRNSLGACRVSIARLAGLAQCSPSTALHAVRELERKGCVARQLRFGYCDAKQRVIYQKSSYYFAEIRRNGFTFVPRNIFRYRLRNSSFAVFIYLSCMAGNRKRAFPSLNRICGDLFMSKSAVCRALSETIVQGLVHSEKCIMRNGAYSSNSYFLISNAEPGKPADREIAGNPGRYVYPAHTRPYKTVRRVPVRLVRRRKTFLISIVLSEDQNFNRSG